MKCNLLLVLNIIWLAMPFPAQAQLNQGEIMFSISNLESANPFTHWMFDVDGTPFVYNGGSASVMAYDSIKWNPDGRGDATCAGNPTPPGTGPGSGLISSSIATDENLALLGGTDGVTLFMDNFVLTDFVHVNVVNPANPWDTPGEAGDYRTYANGTAEIRLNGVTKLKFSPITFYITVHYPNYIWPGIPIGDGGITGYSTIFGEGQIVEAESDPAWVAEVNAGGTGLMQFTSESMSPVIQNCFGAYNANLLAMPVPAVQGPNADFLADQVNGEPPLVVTFTDASAAGDAAITDWAWDFDGDAVTDATGPGPHIHTYNDVGTYSPSLTVTDGNALSDTEVKTNWIHVTLPPQETPGHFQFDYVGASMSGTFSVEGHLSPFTYPSEGVMGTLDNWGDTTVTICAGLEAVTADSANLAGLFITNPFGPLMPGTYLVDPVNRTALIGFAVGTSIVNIPTNPADIEAGRLYMSVSGTIILSEITDSIAVGSFNGVLVNVYNPADMLVVTNGDFVVPTGAIHQAYLSGDYQFNYAGAAMSGTYSVSGTTNEISVPTEGAAGMYFYDLDTSFVAISAVDVIQADSINLSGILLRRPGQLTPGTFAVDALNRTALFAFVVGADVRDMQLDPTQMTADKIYISAFGSIGITSVGSGFLTGTFNGTMLNIMNPTDMLVVTGGSFSMNMMPVLGILPDEAGEIPRQFALHPNYPNPFNPSTTIAYDLAAGSRVDLIVYDILGRKIRDLVNRYEAPGLRRVTWDGRDNFGSGVSAGIYLVQLRAGSFTQTQKIMLLR